MRFRARMLFTLSIVAVSAYAVITANDWPLGTRLFPWAIGIPVFVLALVQLAVEIRASGHARNPGKEDTGDLQVDLSMSSMLVAHQAGKFFAWLLGFFLCIWIFGFFVAVPLYGFFYLKIEAKEGWWLSLALTLGGFIFFVGLFDHILHLPWPTPIIEAPEEIIRSVIPEFE